MKKHQIFVMLTVILTAALAATIAFAAPPQDIVINHVVWDPCGEPSQAGEHIVIENTGTDPINLTGWGIDDNGNTNPSTGETIATSMCSDGACNLAPGATAIIAICDQDALDDHFNAPGLPTNNQTGTSLTIELDHVCTGGYMNNNGDVVALFDNMGTGVSCVEYGDGNGQTCAATGTFFQTVVAVPDPGMPWEGADIVGNQGTAVGGSCTEPLAVSMSNIGTQSDSSVGMIGIFATTMLLMTGIAFMRRQNA